MHSRTVPAALAAALFVALAVLSVVETWPTVWSEMRSQRTEWADATPRERERAAGERIPLEMDVFDFYRDRLQRGDRYYMQVLESGFGTLDLPTTVRTLGNFYLLPAVMVADPAEADVILSWQADPNELGLPLENVEQAGVQPFYVARVASDGG